MNGRHQQRNQEDPLRELREEIEKKPITEFTDKEIFHRNGHASRVAKKADVSSVQLRKVFQEFKAIVDKLKKEKEGDPNEAIERAMGRLYKLYAILEYQANRNVIKEHFKNYMFALFNNIENHKSIEAFEKAYDLLMAIVAYSKTKKS
ncbi:type III-A CRISPR-associated protein Csm2 [Thermocrinis sp.]|jgi:CRISPR type III-A-associated protein Csm2|uniref:type III-A CRISPR-associated protein Csm2 n=1 Tax=Thermocrinis sp. TaxID=2024383 RepID=UPI003BFBE61A